MAFFSKKSSSDTDEAVAKRGIKKMDALVTGAILGGVVASLYGVKKLKKKKHDAETSIPVDSVTADIHQKIEIVLEEMEQKKAELSKKRGFLQKLFHKFF